MPHNNAYDQLFNVKLSLKSLNMPYVGGNQEILICMQLDASILSGTRQEA